MDSTIGIKIANGEFYSIVEENSPVKKRLVLTTVHDKQRSVQIDLYKSYTRTMADALYIGSLVVENIKPRPKGEPSIELVINAIQNGEITADAVDLDPSGHGEHHTLSVSLKSLDEDNREYEIPDFELEHSEAPPSGLLGKASRVRKSDKEGGFPWLLIVCAALVVAAIILALWLFFFRNRSSKPVQTQPPAATTQQQTQAAPSGTEAPAQEKPPEPQIKDPLPETQEPQVAQTQPAQTQPAQTQPAAQLPVIEAPARAPAAAPAPRTRPVPPVASYKVPSVIPREGALYRIRWGDTLWDIAGAFYRNPWLYPRIARFNNIRNPDLIISGTTIRVPPRN